jgi:hypothetical protein
MRGTCPAAFFSLPPSFRFPFFRSRRAAAFTLTLARLS